MNLSVDQQCFGEEILPRMKFVITEAVTIMTRILTMLNTCTYEKIRASLDKMSKLTRLKNL